MPKQLPRGHAARNVTLQVPLTTMHSRNVDEVVHDAADKARLRGTRVNNDVALHTQRHRDTVVRRLFSRREIDDERAQVRASLAQAASNVTPERLKRMGSPGRLAVLALQHASGMNGSRDVKVGQIRSAVSLLAAGGKKQSFRLTPVKFRSARLAQAGASALAAGSGARRVQLRKFCTDSATPSDLAALLQTAADKPEAIASCILIFRSAAVSYILQELKCHHADHKKLMRQLRESVDSPLLRLFLKRWVRARTSNQVANRKYPWFDAVDWLVTELRNAKPASPGATRSPRSPRVSAASAAPASAPSTPARVSKRLLVARRSMPARSSTPLRFAAPARSVTAQPLAPPYALPPPTRLQAGRQATSRRVLAYLDSPTRLAGGPALQKVATRRRRRQAHLAPVQASSQPTPALETNQSTSTTRSVTQPVPVQRVPARTQTLLDIAMEEYEASQASATTTDGTSTSTDTHTEDIAST